MRISESSERGLRKRKGSLFVQLAAATTTIIDIMYYRRWRWKEVYGGSEGSDFLNHQSYTAVILIDKESQKEGWWLLNLGY
jgi:hypothetical protein